MSVTDINIESTEDALAIFNEFERTHQDTFVEKTSSADGQKIITLVIENLPAIITSVTGLLAVLNGKGIKFKLTKDGAEVSSIEEADDK